MVTIIQKNNLEKAETRGTDCYVTSKKWETEEGKEIYRQRKKIVEPVFGQMKFKVGFRKF
ncbi:MAG: hypothetical protein DDT29_01520 [Dehalococcoidia bacterium]|nr:hypothetical protein [Bacillota bacterium]